MITHDSPECLVLRTPQLSTGTSTTVQFYSPRSNLYVKLLSVLSAKTPAGTQAGIYGEHHQDNNGMFPGVTTFKRLSQHYFTCFSLKTLMQVYVTLAPFPKGWLSRPSLSLSKGERGTGKQVRGGHTVEGLNAQGLHQFGGQWDF